MLEIITVLFLCSVCRMILYDMSPGIIRGAQMILDVDSLVTSLGTTGSVCQAPRKKGGRRASCDIHPLLFLLLLAGVVAGVLLPAK